MSWLAEIRQEVLAVIERVGAESLAELGFLLSNTREGNEGARQALAVAPSLRGVSGDKLLSLLAIAIGADAARVASESGALGDALLEGAEREDIASLAADSIDFREFLTARLDAAREVLKESELPGAVVEAEERLRITYLSQESYEHFVADAVEAEMTDHAR